MPPRHIERPSTEATAEVLMLVAARLTRLYARALGQLHPALTFRQYRLLTRVHEGHTSLPTLAAFGNLTLPTISESVDGLVRRGLLTRSEHPADRRSVVLALTAAGSAALEAGEAAMAAVGRQLLADVSEQNRLALHAALDDLYEAATAWFHLSGVPAPESRTIRAPLTPTSGARKKSP